MKLLVQSLVFLSRIFTNLKPKWRSILRFHSISMNYNGWP